MFKQSFKYYKSKTNPPSLHDVVNFENSSSWLPVLNHIDCTTNVHNSEFGLKSSDAWEIFELMVHPGLIFIKNPFTPLGQRYWTVRCLRDFPYFPNRTNLKECFDLNEHSKQLRWATLGYHHNWDTKHYSDDMKSDLPRDLGKLCDLVCMVLGIDGFKAEAAIVNYYYFNSTLSGHTDKSEDNLDAPLFSFSFGQSAIFLIGGESMDEKPTPILIKSGDIVVMSKQSRLCYHGVPRIVEDKNYSKWTDLNYKEKLKDDNNVLPLCLNDNSWSIYNNYLKNSRININVRQVLKASQKCLNYD